MTSHLISTSRPHASILPRAHTDAHQRWLTYGPIQPMDYRESWFIRLLTRR